MVIQQHSHQNLSSTFETIFDEHVKISLRTVVGIDQFDEKIVLDGTDGSSNKYWR